MPKRGTQCFRPSRCWALLCGGPGFDAVSGYVYGSRIFRPDSTDAFSLFVHWIVRGGLPGDRPDPIDYLKREDLDPGEFCALILFATAGMGVMAGPQELLTAFIGTDELHLLRSCQLQSATFLKSNEAAMKYFLLGSFATAFFLYPELLSFPTTRIHAPRLMTRSMIPRVRS